MVKKSNETLCNIQKAAMAEFFEKGYMKASLRKICANAGVTTGALYFFFKDKDDLFCSLVRGPVDEIYTIMMKHYAQEQETTDKELVEMLNSKEGAIEDQKAIEAIMHVMYLHRNEMLLLFTKAQGSSMENIVEKFIEVSQIQYTKLAKKMSQNFKDVEVSPHFARWIAKEQIESCIYAITNIEKEEEIKEFQRNIISYLRSGWIGVFAPTKNNQVCKKKDE